MRATRAALIALAAALLAQGAGATIASGSADRVLGQPDFSGNAVNFTTHTTLSGPSAVVVDTVTGMAFVADTNRSRVLFWNSSASLINGQDADGVIGQQDFVHLTVNQGQALPGANTLFDPTGLALDSAHNLYVADSNNNRVLMFQPPFTTDMAAAVSLGAGSPGPTYPPSSVKPRFVGNRALKLSPKSGSPGTNVLSFPRAVAVLPTGEVWVADSGNNRVVHYRAPAVSGEGADTFLGQAGSNAGAPNQGLAVSSATTLVGPADLALDPSGNLWVADTGNQRLLRFPFPQGTDMAADLLLGATSFVMPPTPSPTPTDTDICRPLAVWLDSAANVWVSDSICNRVLEFQAPITSSMAASLVLGQTDFTSSFILLTSSTSFSTPSGGTMDAAGNLWIGDQSNNRVLRFPAPLSTFEGANLVLGQLNLTNGLYVDNLGMNGPYAVVADSVHGRLFVSDTNNNRVLFWNNISSFVNGQGADGAIGELDIYSTHPPTASTGTSAAFLAAPQGLALDLGGNLWVADSNDNRVLRFPAPFSTGMSADQVLGQLDFSSNLQNQGGPGCTGSTLATPSGVAVDASSNVWVSDTGNERVLMFSPPFHLNMRSVFALGQGGSSSVCTIPVSLPAARNDFGIPLQPAVDSAGTLWVVDQGYARVLGFSPPFSSFSSASVVLGQPNFTASGAQFRGALGVAADPWGHVWVSGGASDESVDRFTGPFSSGMGPDFQLGGAAGTAANLFEGPKFLSVDAQGNLWMADNVNNRVLEFGSDTSTSVFVSSGTSSSVLLMTGPSSNWKLGIPPGAFSQNLTFSLTVPTSLPGNPPPRSVGSALAADISNNLGVQPSLPLNLSVNYSAASVANLGDPTKLFIAYFDTVQGQWVPIPSVANPALDTVSGTAAHLTVFRLFGTQSSNLSTTFVYPNPYRPGSGGAFDDGALGTGVVFANLSPSARIRIFTLSGNLVQDVTVSPATGKYLWNTQNLKGERVASGVYLYVVTNPADSSQKASGKFSIIR